jgi:hypothetical protein
MSDLPQRRPLQRGTQNPLGQRQVFRVVHSDEAEEGSDGAQPHVPCADLILTPGLQLQ